MGDIRLCNRPGCEHAKRRHDDPIYEGGCNVEYCECVIFLPEGVKVEPPRIATSKGWDVEAKSNDPKDVAAARFVAEQLEQSPIPTPAELAKAMINPQGFGSIQSIPSEHPVELEVGDDAPTPVKMRTCAMCKVSKPETEFYDKKDYKGAKRSYCKDCDTTRPTKQTATKQLKTRARHRAVSALVINHREEFDRLLAEFLVQVKVEAEELGMDGSLPRRLRTGPKRKGQTVMERLDVARCPRCHEFHDAGHVCEHNEKAASA